MYFESGSSILWVAENVEFTKKVVRFGLNFKNKTYHNVPRIPTQFVDDVHKRRPVHWSSWKLVWFCCGNFLYEILPRDPYRNSASKYFSSMLEFPSIDFDWIQRSGLVLKYSVNGLQISQKSKLTIMISDAIPKQWNEATKSRIKCEEFQKVVIRWIFFHQFKLFNFWGYSMSGITQSPLR